MNRNGKMAGLLPMAGALVLMATAFFNGFPFVYFDTASYLSSGFLLQTPFDRPISYGIFIRGASLNGTTVWGILFFQCLLLAWLLYRLSTAFLAHAWFIPLLVCTILLSGLSWMAGQLMPDVFTACVLLSLVLLFAADDGRKKNHWLYGVFFLSTAMHISHLAFAFIMTAILWILNRYRLFGAPDRTRQVSPGFLLLLIAIAYGLMASAISKSSHIFSMGTLVENGILREYLAEHCPQKNYRLCRVKDSLPGTAIEFIWDPQQPVSRLGWKESKQEFNEIIRETWTEPRFIAMHLGASARATMLQLIRFDAGEGWGAFGEENGSYQQLRKYFSRELQQYEESLQHQAKIQEVLRPLNRLYRWSMGISAVILGTGLVICFRQKLLQPVQWQIILMLLTGILVNAWVNATLANAIHRLGCKMMWLIPFLAVLLVIRIAQETHKSKSKWKLK